MPGLTPCGQDAAGLTGTPFDLSWPGGTPGRALPPPREGASVPWSTDPLNRV